MAAPRTDGPDLTRRAASGGAQRNRTVLRIVVGRAAGRAFVHAACSLLGTTP